LKYEHNSFTGDNHPVLESDVIFKKNYSEFKIEIRCPKCKETNILGKKELEAVL